MSKSAKGAEAHDCGQVEEPLVDKGRQEQCRIGPIGCVRLQRARYPLPHELDQAVADLPRASGIISDALGRHSFNAPVCSHGV